MLPLAIFGQRKPSLAEYSSRQYPFFRRSVAVAWLVLGTLVLVNGGGGLLRAQTLQHRYGFNGNALDSMGGATGTLNGNAYITNNAIVLPGGGNSDNPLGYVSLPNGIVSNNVSITVECWLTDVAGQTWAEAWCFGDSAAGSGQPPDRGTAYISLIPHSGNGDFRAAFNLTGYDEIDVVDAAGPLPLNVEEYTVVTYDAPSTTARLYLNGLQVATASIPTNQAPAYFGDTFNNWLGRDEFGGDPMFAGSIDELRIWNAATSPLYILVSAAAGPNTLVTNLAPVVVKVGVSSTNLAVGQSLATVVSANFLQVSNVVVTGAATNWQSSNSGVLTVNSSGLITAVGPGTAAISATLNGVTGTSAGITVAVTNRAAGITVAYWQFNNAANLGLDSSRLGNTLTMATGAPAYSSAGRFGGALYLNGASTMTTLTGAFPAGVPVGASPYTIGVWEKADTGNPVNGGFVSWGAATQGNCNALRLSDANDDADSVDNYWWANDFYIDNLATNPDDGNWHAIVATWDGTNQMLYVDGVNVGSRIPTAPAVQGVAFLVGQTVGDNNQFQGWLEDLLIANAALTPAEIATYQAGSWLSTAPPAAQQPTASPGAAIFTGTTLTLGESATGAAPFQYQWRKNGTNIYLATATTLVFTNAQVTNSGNYDVMVANAFGTNTSPVVTVKVTQITNTIPLSVNIVVTNSTIVIGQTQLAAVMENLVQVSNYPTTSATNWTSSNPAVLMVNSSGLITAVGPGSATVSATVNGVTGTSVLVTVSPLPMPTAYYPLAGDVLDHSGNGNDGVNYGATFVSPAYASTGAAVFKGSSYALIPKSIGTTGTGFTIALWVKTTDTAGGPNWYSGEGLVDGEMAGVTTDFGTALAGGNVALGIGQPDTTLPSATLINDGNWHHMAATWNLTSGAMNVYVDGVLSASGMGPTGARVAPPSLRIGSIQTGVAGGFLNGEIDEVRLYNSEFTAGQVAALKNSYSAAPQPGVPVAAPASTVYGGTTVSLTVPVVGIPPYQYQWQLNGTNLTAATSATLVLSNIVATEAGNYDVLVGNAAGTNTSPALTVTVNPSSAPIFTLQPGPANATNYVGGLVTLAAAVSGTQPIACQWQHNGTNILNATATSLTLAALPAGAAGTYTLVASNQYGVTNSAPVYLTVLPAPNPAVLSVLTYHNDNTRRGANTNEVLLTPANVNVTTFGRLITYPTDGLVIAQPLYVAGLVIPGQGTHNVVFVATENDSVYAFDADSNAGTNGGVLWHDNLGIAVSSYNNEFGNRYQGTYYGDITPVVGITGTPVIDPVSGTLYVNVHTREVGAGTNYYHRIHALNITNGSEQAYSPVAVTNSVPGTGRDSTNGIVTFNPVTENQRPGLTLAGGMLYAGYGSYADTDPYHGWVIGFNATNLQSSARNAMCTTPNATIAAFGANAAEGALWMGGNGLCADASNNLYFVTANGSFSANTGGGDYGDSFIRLATTNGLAVADYFTPYNQAEMAVNDTDLGSGGDILLPDSAGSAAHPHLIVGCGKDGILRLVDRDQMGHYNAANDNQVVQEVPNAITGGAYCTPAFFNQQIYYQGSGDVMKAFLITNGVIVSTPTSQATVNFSALGGTPSISANGTNNGIVWALQLDAAGSGGPAVLHAYNATNLAVELYNSTQNPARDSAGAAIIMTTPTVANGKVFVGGQYELAIYGNSLFLATPVISPAGGEFTNSQLVTLTDGTPNATLFYTLDGTAPTTNSPVYTGPILLQHSTSLSVIAGEPGAASSGVASASFVDTSAIGTGTGLIGQYWANTTSTVFTNLNFRGLPTLTRTDATINFNWGTSGPASVVGGTNYCARWTGTFQPQYSELYTFTTTADEGVRLYVNGQLLINSWVNGTSPNMLSNNLPLAAQQYYNLELDYYHKTNNAISSLAWSSPSTPLAFIPQTQLYPQTNPGPAVVIIAPAGNATTFHAPASVTLSADADAPYNPVSQVVFYANSAYLGSVTNAPYTLTTTGLAAGGYALTAVAVDGSGLSATSAPVNILVAAGTGLPYGLTNRPAVPAFFNMPTTYSGGTLPPLLSGTGAFSDTPNRIAAGGLIPYVPNTPLWSDGAVKSRYFAVPSPGGVITPGQQISFCPTNTWTFPAGSLFVKNFDLVVNATNASVPLRRLETRLLVRDINGQVYGVTYKWRPDNSDADLLTSSLTESILITNATGIQTQNWYYPSPADCLQCHTAQANYVLGVNTRQLNASQTYSATGVTDNQLRTLNQLGLFNPAFDEAGIPNFEKLSALTNLAASLQERSRSYLDANCAQCHLPGGSGITFDARYETPLASAKITNYPAAFNLGYDNACIIKSQDIWRSMIYQRVNTTNATIQMPPLARNLIDTNAVQVFTGWINSLPGTPALPPPTLHPAGGSFVGQTSIAVLPPATNVLIYYTLDGSLPTTNSALYNGPFNLLTSATVSASAYATGYVNSVAASALFLVQPLRFTSHGFTPSGFQLGFAGALGSNYVLQASTNLANWTPISTNLALTNYFNWLDVQATNYPQRYYRVLRQP